MTTTTSERAWRRRMLARSWNRQRSWPASWPAQLRSGARDVVRRCSACEQPGHYRVTCPHLAGPRLDHRGSNQAAVGL